MQRPMLKALAVAAGAMVLASIASWRPVLASTKPQGELARAAQRQSNADAAPARKPQSLAEQYCTSIKDVATEARIAAQVKRLNALAQEVDVRLARLEAMTAELKQWVSRRDKFIASSTQQMVSIYAAMRPDAASEQLTRIDEGIAASIVAKLEPKVASTILNDMPAEKAARLATILSGASRKTDEGTQ